MLSILSFLIGSKTGRILVVAGITAAIIGLALWRAYKTGVDHEQAKQLQQRLQKLQNQVAADREVRSMPRGQRDEYVSRWLRDDK